MSQHSISSRAPTIRLQFLFTEHFIASIRRGLGICIPALLIILWFDKPYEGITAALGAFTVSIVDQPGPLKHRFNQMLITAVLSGCTTWLTVISSGSPLLLWLVVSAQAFFFAFLSVYGKQGAYLGAACLTILMIALHGHITQQLAAYHALLTFAGGLFYTVFSSQLSKINWYQQERRAVADCYSSLALYIIAKSTFYLPQSPLTECYRDLHLRNNQLTDSEDAMRNIILRSPPTKDTPDNLAKRQKLINLFIQLVDLHEQLWLGQTDYLLIRENYQFDPIFPAIHDLLVAIAQDITSIEEQLLRPQKKLVSLSYTLYLTALQTHITDLQRRHNGNAKRSDGYVSLIRMVRKLRNCCHILTKIISTVEQPTKSIQPYLTTRPELQSFITRQSYSPKVLLHNFRIDSSDFRHALRVFAACFTVLFFGLFIFPEWFQHSFWILLTVFVILKPAFSLTKERNMARLTGTIFGCALGFLVLSMVSNQYVLFLILFLSLALSSSLNILHYGMSSLFITVTGVIFLHFTSPEALYLIGERGLDTFLGCVLAFLCAHILPKWEESDILFKVRNCIQKNHLYLDGIVYRYQPLQARLHRKNANIAHSNFSASYYRMLQEPASHHQHLHSYHSLLIELDALNVYINDLQYLWQNINPLPENSLYVLESALQYLSLTSDQDRHPLEVKKRLTKLVEDFTSAPNGLTEDTPDAPLPSSIIRHIFQYSQRIFERYLELQRLEHQRSG